MSSNAIRITEYIVIVDRIKRCTLQTDEQQKHKPKYYSVVFQWLVLFEKQNKFINTNVVYWIFGDHSSEARKHDICSMKCVRNHHGTDKT